MSLSCSQCQRRIEVLGAPPSFCPYCGQSLTGATTAPGSTDRGADETVDYQHGGSTVAVVSHVGRGSSQAVLPETLAGYRLIRKIGQGGMGSVHEAEETASGRRVALKLMAPEFAESATAVERFLQEGRLASAIAHPRCVFVLAADQSEGWSYIVMELMPGHTLKDLVEREGPLPQGEAVRKIMDVIEGLQEAHKLGVIHRDVKPSNCFLDADGRVKVGDFGLSKSLLGSDADLTRTGAFLGTPHYASPEQIKGEPVDARSDVYSVAATLYYLLAGGPPHQATEPTQALAKIVSEEAPSVRSIRPDIWSALDQVVMRGLDRDRKRRYRDLEEFREALAPFLPGRVVLGRFGLRAAAYAFDFLATFTFITGMMIVEGLTQWRQGSRSSRQQLPRGAQHRAVHGAGPLPVLPDLRGLRPFEPGEAALPAPGRLVEAPGATADWGESIIRLLVFTAIVIVPRRVYSIEIAHWRDGFGTVVSIWTVIQLASIPILFVTARARNGYRGLHEVLSGTAVVRLPATYRRRSRGSREIEGTALHLARPEGAPREVGPYRVQGALAWEPGRRLLLGEDEGLGRAVWIAMRPSGAEATSDSRRAVGRLARPRWLGAGESDGWAWEAFVAPSGQPLPEMIRMQGSVGWHAAREILEDLAVELDAACGDGTLPSGLSPTSVWVQPDGRVFLIDGLIDPRPSPKSVDDGGAQHRALELLRRVALCALGGKDRGDVGSAVGSPVPGHAIGTVERLCGLGPAYKNVAEFLADLESTKESPPELTDVQKFAHAAYTLISMEVKTWLFPFVTGAYFVWLAIMSGETITNATIPDDVLDSVFLIQSMLWVLVAIHLREGIGGLLFGVTIVRTDGRRASRLRLAWREALRWAPAIAIDSLLETIPIDGRFGPLREYGPTVIFILMPVLYVLPALFLRGRYLHDILAGTAVVPK